MTSSNYNPEIHHRRSIRLKGYDYSSQGAYFVTLCCENRQHRFGEISESKIELTPCGQIATEWMENLPTKFPTIEIDEYIIMPDHIHAIISIRTGTPSGTPDTDRKGNPSGCPNIEDNTTSNPRGCPDTPPPTIGQIIGAYKSLVANDCLKWHKERNLQMGKLWQRNYYEHIIRDEQAYENIRNYIRTNPERWQSNRNRTGSPRGCPNISDSKAESNIGSPRGCPNIGNIKSESNIGDRKGRHNDDNNKN